MTPKEALYRSIKDKWEPIAAGEKSSGEVNCQLCKEFCKSDDYHKCRGCPINSDTGRDLCFETPYYLVIEMIGDFSDEGMYDLHAEVNAAAQMELDYLKDLYDRL